MKYFSQHGEDFILWRLFASEMAGFFVDIGALDGIHFSNTYGFEKAGWRGICVEAHPNYIKYLRKNRPKSEIVHAAVGGENKKAVTFYANKRGALSTLIPSLRKVFGVKYKKAEPKWKPIQVPMVKLDTLLSKYGVGHVDLISMDIEGGELAVLRSFNFDRYKARVWVIEAIDKKREEETTRIMTRAGYTFARKFTNNLFYCLYKPDALVIRNAPSKCNLTRTVHPCDKK